MFSDDKDPKMSGLYINTLSNDALKRYKTKIEAIDGVDPYQLPIEAYTSDFTELPSVRNEDIVEYLVFKKIAFSMSEFKAMKSLQAHNQLTSGFVNDLRIHVPIRSQNRLVTGKVYHSQRMNEKPTQPWIIADPRGMVLSAHCTCVAGIGETCSHVAAVLFTVDTANRITENRTVTDVSPYWSQPSFKTVAYASGSSIDFTSSSSRKRQLDASLAQHDDQQPFKKPVSVRQVRWDIKPTTEEQLRTFFCDIQLKNSGIKPAILSVQKEFVSDYVVKGCDSAVPRLTTLVDKTFSKSDYGTVINKCSKLFDDCLVTKEQCEETEKRTRKQANCALWHNLRAGRVTASRLYDVCRTNPTNPSVSLLEQICGEKNVQPTEAMRWGLTMEGQAKKCYDTLQRERHENFQICNSGLVVNPEYPYMAASPDAICSCSCCEKGCVEIKCPFNAKNITVKEAVCSVNNFCLEPAHGSALKLKRSHPYFYQVQCQIFLCNVDYCDFVVWTKEDLFVERIHRDETFWKEASSKALFFFKKAALPQILCGFFSNIQHGSLGDSSSLTGVLSDHGQCVSTGSGTESDKNIWCYCQGKETEDMIGCDNTKCVTEWFHFQCVGIHSAPKGQWFCPDCRKLPQFIKPRKALRKTKNTKTK